MTGVEDERGVEGMDGFAERLLAVIDDGRRTATYKLAVLQALIDCCAEVTSPTGTAPTELSTRTIARRVAELYWPQLQPFPTTEGAVDLRQITMKSSRVLSALGSAFALHPSATSWRQAEEELPAVTAETVLDVVELTVAREPLVRLQTVDGVPQRFIYDFDWNDKVTLGRLQVDGGASIRFRPGAGDQLVRLAPLLRPLIELHWVRMVARLSRLAVVEDDLRGHLFGANRVAFPAALRAGLLELQEGCCFYCPRRLPAVPAIDHFIPWSRWPNNAVENLVAAHPACNGHKSDRIPGPVPLERWADRQLGHADDLVTIADSTHRRSDSGRSISLARSLYAHLPDGAPVWDAPNEVSYADRAGLLRLLAPL